MFPVAVTCGNTFVLKPSEKDPGKYDILKFLVYNILFRLIYLVVVLPSIGQQLEWVCEAFVIRIKGITSIVNFFIEEPISSYLILICSLTI